LLSVEELGYPHELILSASNMTTNIINGTYRTRIKLFANLLNNVLDKKRENIEIDNKDDPELLILESLTRSSNSLDQQLLEYKEKIEQLVEDFNETQSEPSYDSLTDFLKEGVFLHVLCKELKKRSLFLEKDFVKFSSILDYKENNLKAVFSAIQVWENKNYTNVPHSIIVEFHACNDITLQETMIFLSYVLAVDYPKNKRELLMSHFMLVRRIVEQFREVVSQENLADQVLESLLRTAIILSLCGYMTTLRLPKDEKTRYIDEVLQFPSIEYSIKKNYDEVASISIPHIQIKVPLWLFLALDSVLLLLHVFNEVYLPWEISQLGIKLEIPDVPIFLLFAFIISSYMAFRVYNLKSKILKKFRRGTIE